MHETHPHLLKSGEITPGISALEYHERRAALAAKMPLGSIAILVGNEIKTRSGAVFYEFHQNPDFYYLTGFNEPTALAIIEKSTDDDYTFHMFVQPKNERIELWEGPRTGVQGALDVFNADEAGDIDHAPVYLGRLLKGAKQVFMDYGPGPSKLAGFFSAAVGNARHATTEAHITELIKKYKIPASAVKPLAPLVQSLRAVKSAAEIAVMRTAGRISGRAISWASGEKCKTERELDATLDYGFRRGGCEKSAYVPVVAGGTNALAIHYTRNDNVLHDGDLVLIDAGGQYGGYCADISRAWPVNGRFTAAQRDLYEAVLSTQKALINRVVAGTSLESLHAQSVEIFAHEIKQIGFEVSRAVLSEVLYPHYVGHHLGLDVHDVPLTSRRIPLVSGNVITIEPGLYVPENDSRFPEAFRGMGLRIEDNVAVNGHNPVVLSVEAVKEVVDVEAACQRILQA
ncbi:peptidase M24, structural domain-containing protein [Lipomyces oligophaga]|uniref:peptidase M24, structural domain-containing protein n=1 Tax=Lipomyces oligophaga TaxID=45792 RepID=UPI0034CD1C27